MAVWAGNDSTTFNPLSALIEIEMAIMASRQAGVALSNISLIATSFPRATRFLESRGRLNCSRSDRFTQIPTYTALSVSNTGPHIITAACSLM